MNRLEWDGPGVQWWQIALLILLGLALGALVSLPIWFDAFRMLEQ